MPKPNARRKVPQEWELWTSDTDQLVMVHTKDKCSGICAIHNPSDHHMKNWKRHWREDRGLMERLCPHFIGHPDPDHLKFIRSMTWDEVAGIESAHGCDGCCATK